MRFVRASLTAAVLASLLGPLTSSAAPETTKRAFSAAEVRNFVEQMNTEYRANYFAPTAAEWVAETYITDDTQALTARANEHWLQW
ncbi:MAG: hypothetical protein ACREPX_07555, partial [Rhodanobacteraceae bacterium]